MNRPLSTCTKRGRVGSRRTLLSALTCTTRPRWYRWSWVTWTVRSDWWPPISGAGRQRRPVGTFAGSPPGDDPYAGRGAARTHHGQGRDRRRCVTALTTSARPTRAADLSTRLALRQRLSGAWADGAAGCYHEGVGTWRVSPRSALSPWPFGRRVGAAPRIRAGRPNRARRSCT